MAVAASAESSSSWLSSFDSFQALVFLGKGAGQGLLLRGVAGQQEAVDPATAENKTSAAGQVLLDGKPVHLSCISRCEA